MIILMSVQDYLGLWSNSSWSQIILMSNVCNESGGASVLINRVNLTVITGKPIGRNLCCTDDKEFRRRIKKRLLEQRSQEFSLRIRMLIPKQETKVWGEKRIGNKVDMVAEILGYKPRINTGSD